MTAYTRVRVPVPAQGVTGAPPPRVSALDGYRGIAIFSVMLNHAQLSAGSPKWMASVDFLLRGGVAAFMVLSGYLVTLSLLREITRTGTIDIGGFLRGQMVRLYLPVGAYLFVACLWFSGSPDFSVWRSVRVLWADPNAAKSFIGAGHLYTLAAQLQFFVWWPLLLRVIPAAHRSWLVGALMLGATLWRTEGMARAVASGGNDLRTDFVYAPLLAGAWWACLAAAGRLEWLLRLDPVRSGTLGILILGTIAFTRSPSTVFGLMSPGLREQAVAFRELPLVGLTLRGLVSLSAMVAFVGLAFLLHRGRPAWLSRLFSIPPIAALGRISFSVYLWQSVFCLGITGTPADRFPWSLAFAIAFGYAAYRWVEVPSLEWRSRLRASGKTL